MSKARLLDLGMEAVEEVTRAEMTRRWKTFRVKIRIPNISGEAVEALGLTLRVVIPGRKGKTVDAEDLTAVERRSLILLHRSTWERHELDGYGCGLPQGARWLTCIDIWYYQSW